MEANSRNIIISALIFVLLFGGFLIFSNNDIEETQEVVIETPSIKSITTIGNSIEGRNIDAYTYGSGPIHLLFISGMHGGYEWNSTLLAYTFIDYLEERMEFIPQEFTVTVIPSLNPDGLYAITQKEGRFLPSDIPDTINTAIGRFNAHSVDLNRNFDCKWKPESMWRGNVVSAGSYAFSEPETVAIRDFVLNNNIKAVIFWHSQANTVYASECENGILPETLDIMNTYAKSATYNTVETFDAYEITGDAEGWLASINIPAITVELETHETVEWGRNLKGIQALFEYYLK